MAAFTHPPLPGHEYIRLLTIFNDSDDEPLRCSMQIRKLLEAGQYVAISYCWGEPILNKTIEIDGLPFDITENAWYALWQMRRHERGQQGDCSSSEQKTADAGHKLPYSYWLDFICIEQSYHAEKSSQVSMMHEIYANAKFVAACIGDIPPDCARILEDLHTDRPPGKQGPGAYERGVKNLNSLPYFQRLWIVQEVRLAKNTQVFFGRLVLPVNRLRGREFRDGRANPVIETDDLFKRCKDSLALNIATFAHKKCSHLHDRIYSLLALSSARNLFQPDYGKPLFSLLQEYVNLAFNNPGVITNSQEFYDAGSYDTDLDNLVHSTCQLVRSFMESEDFANDATQFLNHAPASAPMSGCITVSLERMICRRHPRSGRGIAREAENDAAEPPAHASAVPSDVLMGFRFSRSRDQEFGFWLVAILDPANQEDFRVVGQAQAKLISRPPPQFRNSTNPLWSDCPMDCSEKKWELVLQAQDFLQIVLRAEMDLRNGNILPVELPDSGSYFKPAEESWRILKKQLQLDEQLRYTRQSLRGFRTTYLELEDIRR